MHETMSHPGMKDGSWTRAYAEAWRTFYSLENMKTILLRTSPEKYWDVFCNLFWYRNSVMNDGIHPMLGGLVRLKDRANRRACFPLESRLPHLRRRIAEIFDLMRRMLWLLLEMEELWLATRLTSAGVSSRISMVSEQPSLFRVSRFRTTRRDLMKFWIALRRHFRRGEVWMALRVDRILWNAAREIHLAAGFLAAMVKGGKQRA